MLASVSESFQRQSITFLGVVVGILRLLGGGIEHITNRVQNIIRLRVLDREDIRSRNAEGFGDRAGKVLYEAGRGGDGVRNAGGEAHDENDDECQNVMLVDERKLLIWCQKPKRIQVVDVMW